MRGRLQIRGVTSGGEGIVEGATLSPAGRQGVTGWRTEDPADFCRKTAAVFGAEVYRKSTGDLEPRKSAAKDRRSNVYGR
jgi:hypothetical protein